MLDGGRPQGDTHVLVASHSHPAISKGGAEIAAFEMFRALQETEHYSASFLGCSRQPTYRRLGQGITQPFGEDEYVYSASGFDWFKFANTDPRFPREFKRLLRDLRPDIVHFHHYINLGVEAFAHVKEAVPDAKIVLTLHEYLMICHHLGQMIKTEKDMLCSRSGLVECAACFPNLQPADFLLRRLYTERFLASVDHFVSPSRFLAERYVAWGVPAEKISVLENVIRAPEPSSSVTRRPSSEQNRPLRVGFFGQISKLKGINVVFEAARILERDKNSGVSFEIHGEYRGQAPEFQKDFLSRLEQAGSNVHFHGPYQNELVDALMQDVDAVIVPSIWWENSPVVIQEALRNRRPILCSNIGGMAEKVRDGIDGFHFPVGNALGLVQVLLSMKAERGAVEAMPRDPWTQDTGAILQRHLSLYESLKTSSFAS